MGILKDIGLPGLIVIVLGALLIFGPKRLLEKCFQSLKRQLMEEQKTPTQKKIRKNKTRVTVFFLISERYE